MSDQHASTVRAFLQGLTGAGLFRRLDYPGAPAEFIDSRTVDEIRTSGEFDYYCRTYNYARTAQQREDARRNRDAKEDKSKAVRTIH
jgi:hypothetical protein